MRRARPAVTCHCPEAMQGSSGDSVPFAVALDPLLETKHHVPRQHGRLVPRTRLVERLQRGLEQKVSLITAPAGFGKTTLLAEWLGMSGRAVGWLSLDTSDSEPSLFWAYFIKTLRRCHPTVGLQALSVLQSGHTRDSHAVVRLLINDIHATDADFVVVLDDYHLIDSEEIHQALAFLIDHQPPGLHLALVSRSEPPLPLARLRARGELSEIRAADLRFTDTEAVNFLSDVMGIELSPVEAAQLERRTEGWVAGLKLAALSIRAGRDLHGPISSSGPDGRYVADYLIEEVLLSQSERIRHFLLDTSILERLTPALCNTVTGLADARETLELLEKRNLFLVPLDDRRECYRYHHLFRDVLRTTLVREDPSRERLLHRRASLWFQEAGPRLEAVRHAVAAGDHERAAELLETEWPAKDRSFHTAAWLRSVKELPQELVQGRPVLGMGYAWALLNAGELDPAEVALNRVEQHLSTAPADRVTVDPARCETLPAEVASARVYLAQARGSARMTVAQAEDALRLVPEGDHAGKATGLALLSLARWADGDLEPAYDGFSEALRHMRLADERLSAIRGAFVLGDLRVAQGRLREAVACYREGLREAEAYCGPGVPETDELYLGLSEVYREWGDLELARSSLRAMEDASRSRAYAGNRQRWCISMARILEAEGDLEGSDAMLVEALAQQVLTPLPRARPIGAMRARNAMARGQRAWADRWVRDARVTIGEAPTFLREFELITFARLLLARAQPTEALPLLARLAEHGSGGNRIEVLVLQARALADLRETSRATEVLARSLEEAESEGYLRVFVDEGDPIRTLMQGLTQMGSAANVLAAFPPSGSLLKQPIPGESITPREVEILRLLNEGLRNQDIADRLFISPATVKRHLANAYEKLGVRHRTGALIRARKLGLL